MPKRNDPIGEVECPYKGCVEVCKVFKFRPRTEGRRSVFTGKLYADCPVHGRIGNDGNPATQEHYLEKAKIWGANRPAERPGNSAGNPKNSDASNAPEPAPRNPQSSAAPRPESNPGKPVNHGPRMPPTGKDQPTQSKPKWWNPTW